MNGFNEAAVSGCDVHVRTLRRCCMLQWQEMMVSVCEWTLQTGSGAICRQEMAQLTGHMREMSFLLKSDKRVRITCKFK
jgi:hypothetical protein